MKPLFKEEQKFTQLWLWLILSIVVIIPVLLWYEQFAAREPIGDPSTIPGLVLFSIFIFGLFLLFCIIRLRTRITEKEIRMNLFPLVKKRVAWEEVKHAQVVDYGFIGGWGIRLWTGYGTVYNIKGSKGLAIQLTSGKKFVIGTQKPVELQRVLKKVSKNPDSGFKI